MDHFLSTREAKEFLISKIVAEAERENVPLSEVERKMLYFSQTDWTLPDIMEVSDEFDKDYDQAKYEKKVTHLIRNETRRLRKESPHDFASWIGAIRKLKKEDHYITVMIDEAGVSTGRVSGQWGVGILVLVVLCCLIALYVLSGHFGLLLPRTNDLHGGSLTINERLSTLMGYAWVCLIAVILCGSIYSHFDRKRRLYKAMDRIMDGVIGAFSKRNKMNL
jgi:hypothetical protein